MKLFSGLKKLFKGYMIAGTAVLVPLIGTYLILKFIIQSADGLVVSLLPDSLHPETIFHKDIPGIGLVATLILIILVGVFTRMYIGRTLVRIGDKIISKIPLGRGIYGGIKKFMSAILSDREKRFRSVVAIEYPRKSLWVIGFVTSDSMMELQDLHENTLVNVFIPTTPNPTSGFLIMVPKGEIRHLSIGIDEAFKLIISGGIVQEFPSAASPCGDQTADPK